MFDVSKHLEFLTEAFPALSLKDKTIRERTWCESTGRHVANVAGLWLGIEVTLDGQLARKKSGSGTRPITKIWADRESERAKSWARGDE